MKSDARMTAVKGSAEPPRNSHKIDEDPQAAWQLFNANWLIIAVMGSLLALGLTSTNLRLEPIAFGTTLAIAAALLAVSYHHRLTRGDRTDPKLFFSLGTIGQVILTCAIVGPLSYVAGAIGYPLQDQALLSVDRALGLDPEPIIRYVNDHPWLAIILSRAYGLIKWPLLGIPIVLVLAARYARLQLFVLAMSVALAVAIAISVFVPAIGTYYGLQLPPARYPNIDTSVYAGQLRDILALRDGSLRGTRAFQAGRYRFIPELPCRVSRALHVGVVAGTRRGWHRGNYQYPDDRGDPRDRRTLFDRSCWRHSARRSINPGGDALSQMAQPDPADIRRVGTRLAAKARQLCERQPDTVALSWKLAVPSSRADCGLSRRTLSKATLRAISA